jgi:mRNA interferase HigB
MRIIAKRTLREFWEKYSDAETPLKVWYKNIKEAEWRNSNELKRQFKNASIVGNDRIVFNIKGNTYRLVISIDFEKQIVWIKFIGSHRDYDKINAKTV